MFLSSSTLDYETVVTILISSFSPMFKKGKVKSPKPLTATSVSANNASSDTAIFLNLLNDPEVIERVRAMIKNAHVFKLPTRQTVSVGWRGVSDSYIF